MIRSFSKGDVTLSYFDGYDRVFSSSGFNVWDNDFHNHPNGPVIDTVFSYRKTQVIGMGTVLFLGDLTLRTDFAYFTTKDIDNNLLERKYGGTVLTEYQQTNPHQYTTIRRSEEFNINAEYYQANIQFEFELPLDFQIAGQYIQYDTLKYFDDIGLVKPSEFGVVHIDEYYAAEFFFPGLGTNMAILTKSALLLDVTKTFSDNRMKWSLKTMMDQTHSGKLIEIGLDYDINESLKSYLAVTKVFGDDAQDDKYSFNHMEDFSHIRMELKYYY
jgi:hypothetical protein